MATGTGKETVLRVKRKRNDVPFESLWVEVTSRPVKRHEPNLVELCLADAKPKIPDEGASSKLLFRRVETLSPSGVKDLSLPEFLNRVKDKKRSHEKHEPRQTRYTSTKDKQVQLLAATKEQHEVHSRTARFKQVWQSRRRQGRKEDEEDPMRELFHLYDVVHVDEETESAAKIEKRKEAKREAELREGQLLCNYLPLLREVLPNVASEIMALPTQPSEIQDEESSSSSKDYVYDVYTLDKEMEDSNQDETTHPIIQITDDDNHDWKESCVSDYDSEDSNDENNPNNDYPEEEDDECAADGDSNSDSSHEVDPYSMDEEEYDTVLSDEERDIWRPRR